MEEKLYQNRNLSTPNKYCSLCFTSLTADKMSSSEPIRMYGFPLIYSWNLPFYSSREKNYNFFPFYVEKITKTEANYLGFFTAVYQK